ncbi:MAG: tRNA (guanosine(46)-N7)-methyltransferase TrmB [Spirochaetes bacterium]|nr:tRNA (guanosine(46)-N7)-methyltransferase TrmB [Spirochaetota bacterium]
MGYIKEYDFSLLENDVIQAESEPATHNWQTIFPDTLPIIVEIGCGNGHFLVEKAQNQPENNYIGIDIKAKRIIRCREKQTKKQVQNIKWICGEAFHGLQSYFKDQSIRQIYMTFPDPWPKKKHHKKRLFQKDFVDLVFQKLESEGTFVFISDFFEYYQVAYELIQNDERFSFYENNEKEQMSTSVFGQKWLLDNRDIHCFAFKKNSQ